MPRPFIYAPPESPFLTVIHADDRILVLDKPSGLLTVAGKDPALSDCLEARARTTYPSARIVHRLDKDTSGVMILGLTANAHADLGLQFEKRQTRKTYAARVWGHVAGENGIIDKPIATDWAERPCQRIDREFGRRAITEWRVVAREENATRICLTPLTGRSHQLRVHMLDLGHPVLGDNLYAHPAALSAAPRLQLHAETLSLTHPETGEWMDFTVACPF